MSDFLNVILVSFSQLLFSSPALGIMANKASCKAIHFSRSGLGQENEPTCHRGARPEAPGISHLFVEPVRVSDSIQLPPAHEINKILRSTKLRMRVRRWSRSIPRSSHPRNRLLAPLGLSRILPETQLSELSTRSLLLRAFSISLSSAITQKRTTKPNGLWILCSAVPLFLKGRLCQRRLEDSVLGFLASRIRMELLHSTVRVSFPLLGGALVILAIMPTIRSTAFSDIPQHQGTTATLLFPTILLGVFPKCFSRKRSSLLAKTLSTPAPSMLYQNVGRGTSLIMLRLGSHLRSTLILLSPAKPRRHPSLSPLEKGRN
jgi:hypothetical protein